MVLPLYSLYYRKYEETNYLLLRLCESDEFVEILEVIMIDVGFGLCAHLKHGHMVLRIYKKDLPIIPC